MQLKKGLKFSIFYNENNINNIDSCEVRGIVDNYIIVILCKKKKKKFYKTITKDDFEFNLKNNIYHEKP